MVINGITLLKEVPIKDMLSNKAIVNGISHGLSEAGYDIRIKQKVHFKPATTAGSYITLDDGEPHWGRFIIASAIEEFDIPNNLVGVVHDKSTWARQGLSVFNTVIEPGWKGFLTLELVFHGDKELTIPAGSGIAQVLFSTLAQKTTYTGKYQNQENKPVPSRFI